MKKSISIVFLLTLFFNLVGVYLLFEIRQSHIRRDIKHQIKAGVPLEDLHEFTLTSVEYQALDWVRPDIEFRKGLRMFDIVRTEQMGDTLHLYCVHDKDEERLFAQLDAMVGTNLSKELNAPISPLNKLMQLFKLVYTDSRFYLEIPYFIAPNEKVSFRYTSDFSNPTLEILAPPPEIV